MPYLWIELFYIGMRVVRTDGGRAYGHVITQISRMGRLSHFLRYGATLARSSRASRAPLLTKNFQELDWLLKNRFLRSMAIK